MRNRKSLSDGPFMPTTKNEEGEEISKPSHEWSESEKKKAFLNSEAMNSLFCSLDKKKLHRVSRCSNAYEIWKKLEVVYKGTNQVKESKIDRFQMEQNESVHFMYTNIYGYCKIFRSLGKDFFK